ncbi:phosphosulfolactate synthase [Kineosporia sp. R_H_3]|uniref:phosphosulfolactate synthase n=1 Tax=Kineosporia sp. R_H_3 TaxID=1961848 RepID=UPI0018E9C0E3|nr:phosphosulfolactate synthase [Kineosporia sp. R_H_3]
MSQIGPGFLSLPPRSVKPRAEGLTHVLDKGLSYVALESLLQTAGDHIDFVKLGWGTAYVTDGVKAKVALCKANGIRMCPGGTLLEICDHQGRIEDYVRWLQRLGLTHVEVSNGAFGMETTRKRELIRRLSQDFTVLSECGSKNPRVDVVADDWVEEMTGDLEAGASILIAEARESGTVGLYTPTGEVRTELVEAIVGNLPAAKVIFEAPRKDQQAWFVRRLGAVANLGNIPADEVVALETLRLGLRSDTLDLLPEDGPHACLPEPAAAPTPVPLGHLGTAHAHP